MSTQSSIKEILAEKIAGEIVFSKKPEATLRKWRDAFNISQAQQAKHLEISSSVISDYESGRRTPGTRFIKKFVEGIISIDEQRGGKVLKEFYRLMSNTLDAITDMKEFPIPVKASQICQAVDGVALACFKQLDRDIYGYTIIDSITAIQALSGTDFYQLFGSTTERVVIVTNVTSGRSPMVAMRVHPLKPKMVIIQGPSEIDPLAIKLAELERIPLVLSKMATVKDLINALKSFTEEA
ncbi:MAG: helix-turn-helix domain-containing protein [Candidatus Bathyarchaeota archaeon]